MSMLQFFGQISNPLCKVGRNCYGNIDGTGGTGGLPAFISNIISLITLVAGLALLFNFVFAGLQWVTSQGEPKQIENARNKIFFSIIGMVIIAAAYVVTAIISRIFFGSYDAILNIRFYGPGRL